VIVVAGLARGDEEPARPDASRVEALVARSGMSREDAERQVAAVYGVSRAKRRKETGR
jgi:hypothetical protein